MVNKKLQLRFNLALVSFIILFLELLLVRLIGTEIRIFAYLSNLVLLAIFVGSGLGMFIKRKFPVTVSLLLLAVVSVILLSGSFTGITNLLSPLIESFIWFQASWNSIFTIMLGLFLTLLLFFIIMAIFIPLGKLLGEYFNQSDSLVINYSLNIVFSLLGIWAFNLLSFYNVSPYLGLVLASLLLLALVGKKELFYSLTIVVVTTPLLLLQTFHNGNTVWSPYQKLQLEKLPENGVLPKGYRLQVNNVGYMGLLDLSDSHKENLKETIEEQNSSLSEGFEYRNQYNLPYQLKPDVKKVLIIGAGGGNDAMGAVKAGVSEIDAVEIDPQIIALGKKYHPQNPHQAENVHIYVDDGRSYIKKTQEKYDLVVMGLVDSHTLNSSLANLQLDNYLYTKESLSEIKQILNPEGILILSFDVRRPWIGAKLKDSLNQAFGHQPVIFSEQKDPPIFGWGGVFFMEDKTDGTIEKYLAQNQGLNDFIAARRVDYGQPNRSLTDNWPYLYLDAPRIPKIHLIISGLLLVAFFTIGKKITYQGKFDWQSFLLGTGFLLYEFQNISKTSLIYGNTWVTNVFTISAILVFILLANIISSKVKIKLDWLYLLLIVGFIVQIVIPLDFFNQFSIETKYFVVPFILNIPLLFSSLIFIELFSKTKSRDTFFASNLIGSAVGGLLGFFSYLWGIEFLLYLSLFLYLISNQRVLRLVKGF